MVHLMPKIHVQCRGVIRLMDSSADVVQTSVGAPQNFA